MTIDFSDPPFAVEPARNRGLSTSAANARSVSDAIIRPELAWLVRFSLPFDWAASKNALYGRMTDKHSRVFMRDKSRRYRDAITLATRSALRDRELRHTKLWIDIFVEKTKQQGDAINVVDLVCDAIKAAVPIDDRWYSLRQVDWCITKRDPNLFIGIGQEIGALDSKACSFCGQIKPLTEFTFDRSSTHGRGHHCIECRAPSYQKGPNKKHRQVGR